MRKFGKVTFFGRDFDLVYLAIGAVFQMFLISWFAKIVEPLLENDFAMAAVIVLVAAMIFLGPIFLVWGFPWSAEKPQRTISLFPQRGSPQSGRPEIEDPQKTFDFADTEEGLREQISAERTMSRRWEYAYLNYHLVYATQFVLDCLYGLKDSPPSLTWFNATIGHLFEPGERDVILKVLEAHFLIQFSGELIQTTEKGREYVEWRGLDYLEQRVAAGGS